jgi:hypothetical protein
VTHRDGIFTELFTILYTFYVQVAVSAGVRELSRAANTMTSEVITCNAHNSRAEEVSGAYWRKQFRNKLLPIVRNLRCSLKWNFTNSMEQSPYSEANSHSPSQEISRLSW